MFNTIMEIDAMQYASMSREILRNGNFLHFFDNGQPYLDKPPLIFWITALFFKLLGPSDFVYRLPSLIFTIILAYSTYKFSRLYYTKIVSQIAAILLISSQAIFVMNADVRTDIYMMAPMMVSVWQFSEFFQSKRLKSLLIGWVAISFSMMGKGPIGFVIPITILTIDLLYNGKIRCILDRRMIFGVLACLLCLIPMSYGLYTQFGFEGVEFFYWTQSFGRITGASSWSNATGPLYLFNVFLYSFFPWTIIFLFTMINRVAKAYKQRNCDEKTEIVSFLGFVFPMLILSLSNYKLPHYIYCVIPFASVLTAVQINKWSANSRYYRNLNILQLVISATLLLLVYGISFFAFGIKTSLIFIPLAMAIASYSLKRLINHNKVINLLIPSVAASILFSFVLNLGIMKPLLKFQSQSNAAEFIKKNNYESLDLYLYNENEKAKSRSFNFYLDKNIKFIDSNYLQNKFNPKPQLVFTNESGLKELKDSKNNFKIIEVFNHAKVSKLTPSFINPKTRHKVLKKKYLLRFI